MVKAGSRDQAWFLSLCTAFPLRWKECILGEPSCVVSCGDFVAKAPECRPSTLSIRRSPLELGQGASGTDLAGLPSPLIVLLRRDESGQNQTLWGGGEGQHPLRSQLCHPLTSYRFGHASCRSQWSPAAASGISSSMADCMGVFAWEIFGCPCGDGWLQNLCSEFRRFSADLFFAFRGKNHILITRPLNYGLHKCLSPPLPFDVLRFELRLWCPA